MPVLRNCGALEPPVLSHLRVRQALKSAAPIIWPSGLPSVTLFIQALNPKVPADPKEFRNQPLCRPSNLLQENSNRIPT